MKQLLSEMSLKTSFQLFVLALLPASPTSAERVGYHFTGTLHVPSGPVQDWFGMPLSTARPLTGTFSYDTTVDGVDDEPGARGYHQLISGGYSLDVDFGTNHVVIQASDYPIAVANNFQTEESSPPTDQFVVNYIYSQALGITPKRLQVNGTEWAGDAIIVLGLFWDQSRFEGSDEPKLTSDRPGITPDSIIANAGSIFAGAAPTPSISIDQNLFSPISLRTGDYNFDGKVDALDYFEWRNAFGETGDRYNYADGNKDGVIDAADYVVWRNLPVGDLELASIPEPDGSILFVSWIFFLVGSRKQWHRDARQR